jgi:hypothetical protein
LAPVEADLEEGDEVPDLVLGDEHRVVRRQLTRLQL